MDPVISLVVILTNERIRIMRGLAPEYLHCNIVNLTNRFHVAVRLFSNRSQMTSKCGKKTKKGAHEPSIG